MTPTLPRRSFLGWTAAIAGCALLTRPALAVPDLLIVPPKGDKYFYYVCRRDPATGIWRVLDESRAWRHSHRILAEF